MIQQISLFLFSISLNTRQETMSLEALWNLHWSAKDLVPQPLSVAC